MTNKLITGPKPFSVIAPVIRGGGSDPSTGTNRTLSRKYYKYQTFTELSSRRGPQNSPNSSGESPGMSPKQGLASYSGASAVRASGTMELPGAINGPTHVLLGGNTLTSGVDFTNAATLAAAIDSLEGFNASEAAGIVSVQGPYGLLGNQTTFDVTGYSSGSFDLTPDSGTLGGGEPFIGPPEIG